MFRDPISALIRSETLLQNHLHVLVVLVLLFNLLALYLLAAIYHPLIYIWITYEDLIGEWSQFYFFLATCLLASLLAQRGGHYRPFFILLALACFYVSMEEISWGQRIFGWRATGIFEKYNLQGETNIHNLFTGPYATRTKEILTIAISLALLGYGLLYPLALKLRLRPALWLDRLGLAAPPLYLSPIFIAAAGAEMEWFHFNEAEVAELLVGLGLAFTALHFYSRDLLRREDGSLQLAGRMALLFMVVVSLAGITTALLYSTEAGEERIERRITNGLRKFAYRYANYGAWEKVVFLEKLYLTRRPRSPERLRHLARAYRELGREDEAQEALLKAIALDLERLESSRDRASLYRSLAKSYLALGQERRARLYLRQAQRLEEKKDGKS